MKNACYPLLLLFAFIAPALLHAQDNTGNTSQEKDYFRNTVKMNLSSLAFNNYHFSYERVVTRKTAVLASFRTMPQTNLGNLRLAEKAIDLIGDEDIQNDLDAIAASNQTFTAEIRFYGGRKPGARGFYLGLYGRLANFDATYRYNFTTGQKSYDIPLQGSARGIGAGFVTGWQFAVARRVTVDIFLLGAHYGTLKGDFKSDVNLQGLTTSEQQMLQEDLNELLVIKDENLLSTTVSNTGVTGAVKGPFAGVRGLGLTVGIAF